jgi:hypothetical protein
MVHLEPQAPLAPLALQGRPEQLVLMVPAALQAQLGQAPLVQLVPSAFQELQGLMGPQAQQVPQELALLASPEQLEPLA